VQEFFQRKALAKLGIHGGSTSEISWEKAERLLEVHNEIEKIKAEDHKKATRKRG
jgi:hypothetical protein